ncbi:hypothetical protein [Chryseobacterium sp. MYb328]|uniref:hypothetical protein n=1 Tax=Chryseobacterium sp. MYb328 TaxID=2745231 RepID=UPI0030A40281
MKLKLFFLATILLAFTSCSSSNDEIETEKEQELGNITKLSSYFPFSYATTELSDPNYYFEYDAQNRVIKKNGMKMRITEGGFDRYFISNKVYTQVTYNGNFITTSNHSSGPGTGFVPLQKKVFELDSKGKIKKCVVFLDENIVERELIYQYQLDKLVAIVTEFPKYNYPNKNVNRFTYYSDGNLKSVKTVTMQNNVDIYIQQEVQFSNYDKAPNPLKKLYIFDEYIHSSLSKNNYQKIVTLKYIDNKLVSQDESSWFNQYNADGTIKLFY